MSNWPTVAKIEATAVNISMPLRMQRIHRPFIHSIRPWPWFQKNVHDVFLHFACRRSSKYCHIQFCTILIIVIVHLNVIFRTGVIRTRSRPWSSESSTDVRLFHDGKTPNIGPFGFGRSFKVTTGGVTLNPNPYQPYQNVLRTWTTKF